MNTGRILNEEHANILSKFFESDFMSQLYCLELGIVVPLFHNWFEKLSGKSRRNIMQAIEFIAKAKKGTIEIPKEYQEQLRDQFRVIILQEVPEKIRTKEAKIGKAKRKLTAAKIKTKGLKFTRDEANER